MDRREPIRELAAMMGLDFRERAASTLAELAGGRAPDTARVSRARARELWQMRTAPVETELEMRLAGASTEDVLKTCFSYRYALGKAAGKGSLRAECEFHEEMAAEIARLAAPTGLPMEGVPNGPE